MGRLIDADDVKKLLVARYENAELITKYIDKIPTAYDVNKVVEQLEEERDLSLKSTGKYYHKPLVRAHYQNAISIVKGGGQA